MKKKTVITTEKREVWVIRRPGESGDDEVENVPALDLIRTTSDDSGLPDTSSDEESEEQFRD